MSRFTLEGFCIFFYFAVQTLVRIFLFILFLLVCGVYVMVCMEVGGQPCGVRSLIPATWDPRIKPRLLVNLVLLCLG